MQRQTLKRRFKRDFIDFDELERRGAGAGAGGGGGGPNSRQNMHLSSASEQMLPRHQHERQYQSQQQSVRFKPSTLTTGKARFGAGQQVHAANQQPARPAHPHRLAQDLLEAASGSSLGNLSSASFVGGQRMRAPPSPTTPATSALLATGVSRHQQQQQQQPFNDPSWPLMWYLVSGFGVWLSRVRLVDIER